MAYSRFAGRTDRQRAGDEVQSTHDDKGCSRFADERNELDARDWPSESVHLYHISAERLCSPMSQ